MPPYGSPLLNEVDDPELASRAAQGDQVAFARLVARHERRLRHFLGRLAGTGIGDELAQECFLRAWQRAGDYRGRGSYAGWLYRIGWRLFLDSHRLAQRRAAHDALEAAGPDAEPHYPAADAALDLERLLARLDARSRAALVLCDGHGWSHAEAAEMLGLPLGTLKSLVARAKVALRAGLQEGEP